MPRLTDEQLEEARNAFNYFDKNKDGHIAYKELMSVLQASGQNPTRANVQKIIEKRDDNSNGKIEFNEFLDILSESYETKEQQQDELRKAFRVFDRDGNGFITSQELKHVMTSLGERMTNEEVDEMMREADTNGDGRVDYHEFVKMMTSRH